MIILSLESTFSSAHLYYQPKWSEEKNREEFGRCYSEHGHGHNYTLQVGFKISEDEMNKRDDYLALLFDLTDPLEHKHLNFDIPEFKNKVPTTENIALYFLEKLKNHLPVEKISYIRLREMDNLWTEIKL